MISCLVILPGSLCYLRKGTRGKRIWLDGPYEATRIAITLYSLDTFPFAASFVMLQKPTEIKGVLPLR